LSASTGEEVRLRDLRLADHAIDKVDRPRVPVDFLVFAQRLAADGEAELKHLDGLAQRQGVAFNGGGIVRPHGGDPLQELVAEVRGESLVKKARAAALAAALGKGEHRVVRHREAVNSFQVLGDLPETPAVVQQGKDLRLIGDQLRLERFAGYRNLFITVNAHTVTTYCPFFNQYVVTIIPSALPHNP